MNLNSSDLENKISSLLANPEAMASVINMVKAFAPQSDVGNVNREEIIKEQTNSSPIKTLQKDLLTESTVKQTISSQDTVGAKSIGLLLALKPFLSDNKSEKIDVITKLLKIATLTELFK